MTIAIGPSISRPEFPLPSASGSLPSPVTVAVIRIGVSLSIAHAMPSQDHNLARNIRENRCDPLLPRIAFLGTLKPFALRSLVDPVENPLCCGRAKPLKMFEGISQEPRRRPGTDIRSGVTSCRSSGVKRRKAMTSGPDLARIATSTSPRQTSGVSLCTPRLSPAIRVRIDPSSALKLPYGCVWTVTWDEKTGCMPRA
jgi:hypothetical protein